MSEIPQFESDKFRVSIRKDVTDLPAYVPGSRGSSGQSFKLSSNENPYQPLPSVLGAIADASLDINRYPDMAMTELIEELAAYLGEPTERIAVGNGSVAVLGHLLQAVCEPRDEVIFGWRSFEAYPIATAIAGAQSVKVPLLMDGRLDLPAMAAAVTEHTKVILVCTPNNPTGPVIHKDELDLFMAQVPERVLVVIDEAYLEFVRDPEAPAALEYAQKHANVVVLRSLSKAFGLAGLRVGYAVGHKNLITAVRAVSTPFGVSHIAQVAAVQSLRAIDELQARVEALVQARTRVVTALAEQGWELPTTEANFVWFPLGDRTAQRAAEAGSAGLIVRPFAGEGIRVTIGEDEALDDLLDLTATWLNYR